MRRDPQEREVENYMDVVIHGHEATPSTSASVGIRVVHLASEPCGRYCIRLCGIAGGVRDGKRGGSEWWSCKVGAILDWR